MHLIKSIVNLFYSQGAVNVILLFTYKKYQPIVPALILITVYLQTLVKCVLSV